MPYLPVDFDARAKYPAVAQGLVIHVAFVTHGMEEMWQNAWRTKSDLVSPLQLECFFGAEGNRTGQVLEAFGFLEWMQEPARYRIRGAGDWLRIPTSRAANGAEGGKKTAASGKSLGNLKQNRPKTTVEPETPTEANASEPPKQTRSKPEAKSEALTSSIQHPTSNTSSEEEAFEPMPPRAPKPRALPSVAKAEKPTAERHTWGFQEFQQWAQYTRQRDGLIPEDPVPIFEGDRWWGVVTEWTGGAVQPVCDGFIKFGQSKHWATADPPYPLQAFMSQWKKFMPPKEMAHAAR